MINANVFMLNILAREGYRKSIHKFYVIAFGILLGWELMKTKLLDGEKVFRTIHGIFCKDEVESSSTCFLTDRRLIFEDADILEREMSLGKELALDAVLLAVGAPMYAGHVHREKGVITIYHLDELINLKLSEIKIEATTLQANKESVEKVSFKVEKVLDDLGRASEQLTVKDQKGIQALVKTARERKQSQKKELDINDKLSFLTERRMKQGFINLELKLEDDISRIIGSGKTREQAIEELYEEEARSA
jgi:hypothetical protein